MKTRDLLFTMAGSLFGEAFVYLIATDRMHMVVSQGLLGVIVFIFALRAKDK